MSEHIVNLSWKLEGDDFNIKKYNREHTWTFKNGEHLRASAAVAYLGKPDCVDPEEAFVASIASCHMLTFLAVASMKGFKIVAYQDTATGILAKNENGKMAITEITLKPHIEFAGDAPSADDLKAMHDKAHADCFIANSATTKIKVAS